MIGVIVLVVILVLLVLYVIAIYNGLVVLRNRVQEAWSDIEVQMKRRYDLIPNLVETVKGYAAHESSTFEKVVHARNQAMANHGTPSEIAKTENVLSGTLKSLFALAENYPDLKANVSFEKLQFELKDTEDRIAASRRFYNTNVLALNTKIEIFPSNIVAKRFNFDKREFFELDESEAEAVRKPVAVKF
ncbi:MAG: LemA family protein [Elusimicrobiota bacterium]|jgi:LemA protein|nr:LemA family protein [Elusimicrobiota bacterium]